MTSLLDETLNAGRGLIALLLNRRDAPSYFNLTAQGLAGSFIAFVVALAVQSLLLAQLAHAVAAQQAEFASLAGLQVWQALLAIGLFSGLQYGFAAIAMAVMKRLDGYVPYLVASNWSAFYLLIASILLSLTGILAELFQGLLFVVFLILQINVARLVATLKPMQVAGFLLVQFLGLTFVAALLVSPAAV